MIDLSTPDTLLYDSAVLSSYIRKNTKESFGYIFLIISIILLSFTMTIECVMWLIRIFSILSSVVPSILVLIRMNVLTAVLKRPSLIPALPWLSPASIAISFLLSPKSSVIISSEIVLSSTFYSSLPEIPSVLLPTMLNSEKTKDSKSTESSENPLPPISIRIQRIMLFLVPSLPFILLADPLNLILISTCLSVRMPSISGRTTLKALPIWISISSEKPGCFRSLTFLTGKSTQDNSMHLKITFIKTIPTVSMSMPKNQKKTRAKMMLMIPSHI